MKDSFMEGLWTYLFRKRGNFSACFIFNHEVQVLAGLDEEKGLCLGQLVISNSILGDRALPLSGTNVLEFSRPSLRASVRWVCLGKGL